VVTIQIISDSNNIKYRFKTQSDKQDVHIYYENECGSYNSRFCQLVFRLQYYNGSIDNLITQLDNSSLITAQT